MNDKRGILMEFKLRFGKLDGFMSNHLEQTGDWNAQVQELALFVSSIFLACFVIVQIN